MQLLVTDAGKKIEEKEKETEPPKKKKKKSKFNASWQ